MPDYISHIILLPQGAGWGWYEAIRNYVLHFRVTVTQSADDAGSFHGTSHTITVIDVPGAWPGDIVDWLRQNYPDARLDVVSVTAPDEASRLLDRLVAVRIERAVRWRAPRVRATFGCWRQDRDAGAERRRIPSDLT